MRLTLISLFLILSAKCHAQQMEYFKKIGKISSNEVSASNLYNKFDSLKKTRRPNDSKVEIYFNRDVDFGYRHERINVVLNSFRFVVNLLTKNDTIHLASVSFDDTFYNNIPKKSSVAKIDSNTITQYLNLRNGFYKSSKNIADVIDGINRSYYFAAGCGDGSPTTKRWRELEALAKDKRIHKLKGMLQDISCEEQAYGEAGFEMLAKNGVKIPDEILKIVNHVKDRKSALVICTGCLIVVDKDIDE